MNVVIVCHAVRMLMLYGTRPMFTVLGLSHTQETPKQLTLTLRVFGHKPGQETELRMSTSCHEIRLP